MYHRMPIVCRYDADSSDFQRTRTAIEVFTEIAQSPIAVRISRFSSAISCDADLLSTIC